MDTLFLDTNVVLDVLGNREPYYMASASVVSMADRGQARVIISPVSCATIAYVLERFLPKAESRKRLKNFLVLCDVSTVNQKITSAAIGSRFEDFEDALQHFSAVDYECDVIITRNVKDFKHATIPVMTPTEYLAQRSAR
ncbi:MAG: PIN domain-containing protein [Flavobacteriales bacterium]|nr:PIN domain-containing protein [Bacteroidota bacterium]MCB9240616.1 PIN domain-containing protein [Flavobacteriales bacterium]